MASETWSQILSVGREERVGNKVRERGACSQASGHDVQAMTTADRPDKRRRNESGNTSNTPPASYVPGWPSLTDSEVKRNSVPSSRDMVVGVGWWWCCVGWVGEWAWSA